MEYIRYSCCCSDIDEWTKPLLYEFDIDVRKYTESQNEIVLHIITEPIEE